MTEPLEVQALRGERTLLHRCLALALVVVEFYINSAPRGDPKTGPCWCALIVPGGHTAECDARRRAVWEFLQASRPFRTVAQSP